MQSMSTTMASFSPPTHFSATPSSHSKPRLFPKTNFLFSLRSRALALSPLKTAAENGVGTAVEPPPETSPPPLENTSVGTNGAAASAAAAVQSEEVKVQSGFVDPRWVSGTWDLKQFQKNQNSFPETKRNTWASGKMAVPERNHNRFYHLHHHHQHQVFSVLIVLFLILVDNALCIRFPDRVAPPALHQSDQQRLQVAVFALGSFWRSEAVFGCLPGVVHTTVGYAGGSKSNPEYRSLGDHAECVKVEYDPQQNSFRDLLDVFWSNHDPRQVYGQGPDVGKQYRSIIFVNGTEESRMASVSKEQEQTRSRSSIVTTQILQLGTFYPAEPDHQKFELKQNTILLQLIGNLPAEELERSSLATKLNGYVAELCPPNIQKRIDAKINDIIKRGWPILREL